MSERLTSEWTPTAEGAFGETGARGREGELFVKKYLESMSYEVTDNESDYHTQLSGQDLIFTIDNITYSVDIKSNLRDDGGFYVEGRASGWLFKKIKTSDFICHVNTRNGQMMWYRRDRMKQYVINNKKYGRELIFFRDSLPSFIKEKHYEP
jgi:hypothetical protein